jgi:ATP-binding protein involved in chromosome partitioning
MSCGEEKRGCAAAGGRKADEKLKMITEDEALARRLSGIKHKILVLSGKGGVGKSTVAVNLAVALCMRGKKVGLLDVDFHGPSVPKLLRMEGELLQSDDGGGIMPLVADDGIRVVSLGFALGDTDEAVIWRGPMKIGVIKQFLKDVQWGELDHLVVDFPPGTGDEPLSVAQYIPESDGAVIVTTPQDLSLQDVRKSINFCRHLDIPVLGVIENMSGLICPHCGRTIEVFKSGGGEAMAVQMGVPFLGRIPIDPRIVEASDQGQPFVRQHADTQAAQAFMRAIRPILCLDGNGASSSDMVVASHDPIKEKAMRRLRVAVPLAEGRLSSHFGHCQQFALFDTDPEARKIIDQTIMDAPPHEPGLLPKWLKEKGADVIIAGGMGSRARDLFQEKGIQVIVGAPADVAPKVVLDYLSGALKTGDNVCDH